jgi:hypothetical protein
MIPLVKKGKRKKTQVSDVEQRAQTQAEKQATNATIHDKMPSVDF